MKRRWLFLRSFIEMTLIVIFLLFIPPLTFSQNSTQNRGVITGVVTDENGAPLSGVSIAIKGSAKATTSNEAGKYSISAGNNSTLVFSYVGFGSREIPAKSQTIVNVKLEA